MHTVLRRLCSTQKQLSRQQRTCRQVVGTFSTTWVRFVSHGPTQFPGTEHGARASFSAGTPNQGRKAFPKRTKSYSFPPSSYLCQTCMQWKASTLEIVYLGLLGLYSEFAYACVYSYVCFVFDVRTHTLILFDSVMFHPSHLQTISRMECLEKE